MTKFTVEMERLLLDDEADPIDRAHAISCMRFDGVQRHESLLIAWLDHEVEDMRSQALATLLSRGRDDFAVVAFERLRTADTPDERVSMASALSAWGMARPARRKQVLEALVARLEEEQDLWAVRRTYVRVRDMLGLPNPPLDEDHFDRERDVDWSALAPYRGRANASSGEPAS